MCANKPSNERKVGRAFMNRVVVLGLTVAAGSLSGPALAQTSVRPAELAALRQQFSAGRTTLPTDLIPQHAEFMGVAEASEAMRPVGGDDDGLRAAVDLYRGLQSAGNGFWLWTSGGSETVYWALDDGRMGPGAAAAGGGHVTELELAFGLHGDFAGDSLRPYIIVSFYNAPADPVVNATNPVVEPPAPVQSIGVLFDPITLPGAGFYAFRSGLLDLTAAALDFDLDETFHVEIFPLEWSSYPGGSPVFDPDVFAVFTGPGTVTYGVNQNRMWSDLWFRDGSCLVALGNGDGYYNHPAEMDVCNHATRLNQSGIILRGTECVGANQLELSINDPDDACVQPGDTVTVMLSQSCLPGLVRGYQAFLSFDPSRLALDSGAYLTPWPPALPTTLWPYGLPILTPISATGPDIDVAAGIDDPAGQPLTSASAELAWLTFTAGATDGLTNVVFRTHDPPTRFSDPIGLPVVPTLVDSPYVCIDGTGPSITCPPAANVQCLAEVPAAATNYAAFVAQGGLAGDAGCCGSDVTITHQGDTNNGGAGCPASPLIITRTYRATDESGNWTECSQTITVIDSTAPVLSGCPDNIPVNADAGGCTAVVTWTNPTAADNCDPSPAVVCVPASGSAFPEGTTPVTCTATDDCGNSAECSFDVTVSGFNEMVVNVELSPTMVAGPITRCITFELWDCPGSAPYTVETENLPFTGGVAPSQTVLVECGAYDCVTARDELHTLRSTRSTLAGGDLDPEPLRIEGTRYKVSFTGKRDDEPGSDVGGHRLIGGNLNGDFWVDILDFGAFSFQWAFSYGSGNTPCGTPAPHADINGNGLVGTEDFTFIQINFLLGHEDNCCAQPGFRGGDGGTRGPVVRIALGELAKLGWNDLAAGDLNGDGWLDQQDVAAFMMGARPALPQSETRVEPPARPRPAYSPGK